MSPQPTASIIICTQNRAEHLRQTLAAMARVCVPDGLPTELLVVDNASADHTAEVVRACRLPDMPVRCVHEPRRGKGYAYNTGMAQARGDVLLFTDDDVRPPRDWIAGMCAPILGGWAAAVAGGVRFAPHLQRSWMTPEQRHSLASTERLKPEDPEDMVGANMAFSKGVLDKVPRFDTELGPGALGFGDETLFSWQLRQAGYRLAAALDVAVEHHFDETRLSRHSMIESARKFGKTRAYLAHHWHHEVVRRPRLYLAKRSLRLAYWRVQRRQECSPVEGLPLWEQNILMDISFYRQYLIERRRPRNYDRYGLVKRDA